MDVVYPKFGTPHEFPFGVPNDWEKWIMMDKFDKWDRKRVVGLIQEKFDVTLSAVESRDIWFRDESGAEWWILGGKGDFHGISEEMMARERGGEFTGRLVFARKLIGSLNVYIGPLLPLIDAKHSLSRRKEDNAYLFNVVARKDSLRIVEAPSVVLKKIDTIQHSDSDRESARNVERAAKMFASLSQDQRDELLKKLEDGDG